MLNKELGSNNY